MIHVKYLIIYKVPLQPSLASLVAQRLKRPPAMRETWVRSVGQEDSMEKEMATHSSILAWRTPWMEEPGRLQFTGSQRVGHDWATSLTQSVLPKAHSHSRMFGSGWVTIPSWLRGSLRSLLYSSFMYSFHLFLISSASIRSSPNFCPLLYPSLDEMFLWYF